MKCFILISYSWPNIGKSQHWQDTFFQSRTVLCSEVWKVVFWIWSCNRWRYACWLGQARLSTWHWTGSWWPSICFWRKQSQCILTLLLFLAINSLSRKWQHRFPLHTPTTGIFFILKWYLRPLFYSICILVQVIVIMLTIVCCFMSIFWGYIT